MQAGCLPSVEGLERQRLRCLDKEGGGPADDLPTGAVASTVPRVSRLQISGVQPPQSCPSLQVNLCVGQSLSTYALILFSPESLTDGAQLESAG